MTSSDVISALKEISDESKVKILSNFFKTGEGQYGSGDIFWGIKVPDNRKVAKQFTSLPINEVSIIIENPVHEVRLCGFLILVDKYQSNKKNREAQKEIVSYFLSKAKYANNWDLVDLSAPKILGDWLSKTESEDSDINTDILYHFAQSENLWERRIAIVTTWTMIRNGNIEDTYRLADILMTDTHDLIRKAVGWMIRETGKQNRDKMKTYLELNAHKLSRTSLRYAIEHLSPEERKYFMNKGK